MTYRNPKLLEAARECPRCMHCGAANHGQVVAAHSNELRHGKGMGIKAHDLPAYLCDACHAQVDGQRGGLSRDERQRMWRDACVDSLMWAAEAGYLGGRT